MLHIKFGFDWSSGLRDPVWTIEHNVHVRGVPAYPKKHIVVHLNSDINQGLYVSNLFYLTKITHNKYSKLNATVHVCHLNEQTISPILIHNKVYIIKVHVIS